LSTRLAIGVEVQKDSSGVLGNAVGSMDGLVLEYSTIL